MAWIRSALAYLWSGWGAIASILLFLAFWDAGHQIYGGFILPSPLSAFSSLVDLVTRGDGLQALLTTTKRALIGLSIALLLGSSLGVLAGLSKTTAMTTRPLITLMIGIPPIAWIVLAMLWFGATDATPVFTVLITTLPITFAGAVQGARTLDDDLRMMADSFGTNPWLKFIDVYLPHILSYLFPAWITALGMSWKVVVMAELMSSNDGVGAGMAAARVNLDTAQTMAWIIAIVTTLLLTEYLLLEPFKRRVERWRERT